MKRPSRFTTINILILIFMIVIPGIVLASIPTTTSYNRENVYTLDGYRPGGYYITRHNPGINGYMNISHDGGTRYMNITSYNIKNMTLDFDDMFSNRRFLYGWLNVSWLQAIDFLDDEEAMLIVNVDTTEGIDEFSFVDYPNVYTRVTVDDVVVQDWHLLSMIEIPPGTLTAGQHEIKFEFILHMPSILNTIIILGELLIVLGITVLILRLLKCFFFVDEKTVKDCKRRRIL